jgi:hypothetical protein
MFLGIQVAGVLFGLFMVYITFLHRKRDEFKISESIFWFLAWVIFIFLVIYPHSLDFIVKSFKFNRTMDLYTVLGFMFVIGSTFYNYTNTKKTQKKVEAIVQKIAIENVYKNKK